MHFAVISLFPEMLRAISDYGITRRACEKKLIKLSSFNPRDFTQDKHRTVDDRPYGGGPGMVMMIEPIRQAIHQAKAELGQKTKVIYLSPQGQPLKQKKVEQLSQADSLILLAGRYEGIDQRIIDQEVDEEISIGDFVVSGGELPAMLLIDAVARCIDGVLGHQESALLDSFATGILDHPHYTRPEDDHGNKVPEVLLGGNHQAIQSWRLEQALKQTWLRRPDLLQNLALSNEQLTLLQKIKNATSE